MRGLVALAAWAGLASSAGAVCTTDRVMDLIDLTGAPGATCADGSQAGFYVDTQLDGVITGATDFVIWLGDGDLCENEEECDRYCDIPCADATPSQINSTNLDCYYNTLHCGSALWPAIDMFPETVMCGEADENPFANYTRVFVPQCSLDWFLGTADLEGSDRFRGSVIMDAVMARLRVDFNLTTASRVVMGGTRGGGVGAAHQAVRLREGALPPADVRLVLDSAWLQNQRQFGVTDYNDQAATFQFDTTLQRVSTNWIAAATIVASCRAQWDPAGLLHRCLFAQNLLGLVEFGTLKTFIIQAQFDLEQLLDNGVTDPAAAALYVDDAAYSQAVLAYIKGFGQSMRQTFEEVSVESIDPLTLEKPHYWWAPACGQHAIVVPAALDVLGSTVEAVGEAGSVLFKRDGSEWDEIEVNRLSARAALELWAVDLPVESALAADEEFVRDNVRADRCGEFLCNPSCVASITSFQIGAAVSDCEQNMVVSYCFLFIGIMFAGFFVTRLRVVVYDRKCRQYWARKRREQDGNATSAKEVEKQILKEAAANAKGRSLQLMVQNVNYWAPGKKSRLNKAGTPFQVLKNVSVSFEAGTVHAMMGPSGSGKSTLLDIVSYTRDSGQMTGTHFINGVESHIRRAAFLREWLRNSVSYVRQTDVLFPRLTVREHLQHSAWLMLPQYMGHKAKLHRVWQVIKLLELDGCADTICGDGGVRVEGGISGGQRRRVSVATQLLKMPAALLLDEPTSGLDSTNALLLVQALSNLAHKAGVTVVMTIHQPRREIFELLDALTILVRGRVIFSGKPADAGPFFNVDLSDSNVGDEILDLLQASTPEQIETFRRTYESGPLGQQALDAMEAEKTYLTPDMAVALRSILVENALAEGRWSWTEATNTMTALWVLMSRTIKRGGFDLLRTSFFALCSGVLVGLVFLGSDTYTGHTALLYLATSTLTFLQGTFLGDRYMLEKQTWSFEKDNGTTVPWTSFLISLFLRNVVTSTVEAGVYAVPVFFMGNLFYEPQIFVNFMLLMVLTGIAVTVQNATVEIDRIRRGGDAAPDTRQAILINMSLLSLSALFNGFIIPISDIPAVIAWLPYTMLTFWSYTGLLVNNFATNSFPCDAGALECAQRTGANWIRSFEYELRDPYTSMFALLLLILLLHVVSVLDFYYRFAHSTSQLKRGRPAKVGRSQDDDAADMLAGLGSSTPRLGNADTGASMANLMNKGNGDDELEGDGESDSLATGSRGKVLGFLLSRQNLALFFLLDVLFAFHLCFFTEGGSIADDSGEEGDGAAAFLNNTKSVLDGLDISGADASFFIINIFLVSIYVLQFIVQILFLVPLSGDGKRKSIVWISWHDLLALVFLTADAALVLGLFAVAAESFVLQLAFVASIRIVRFSHVTLYWYKVDSFHRSRARTFLAISRGEYEFDTVYDSVVESEGPFPKSDPSAPPGLSKINRRTMRFGGPPPFVPRPQRNTGGSGKFNSPTGRVSGKFGAILGARGAPPPVPPKNNRASAKFRQMDLGDKWKAFQNNDADHDVNQDV